MHDPVSPIHLHLDPTNSRSDLSPHVHDPASPHPPLQVPNPSHPIPTRRPGLFRYVALTLLTVLLILISVSIWQYVTSRHARAWVSEFPSLPPGRIFEVARTHSARFTTRDWQHLGSEALRDDTRFESWISSNSGALPGFVRPLLPDQRGQRARWQALDFAWTTNPLNLDERRENLLRLAVDSPPHLRWRGVELAVRQVRLRTPSETNDTSILTATQLDFLEHLADDPDPLVRTYVVMGLQWPAPGQESRVNALISKLSADPNLQVAEAATRTRAQKPSPHAP